MKNKTVTRYQPPRGRGGETVATMIPQANGGYVKYGDYKRILEELDAAYAEIQATEDAFHRVEAVASQYIYGDKACIKVC